jgi:hypothetical protein
MTVRVLQPAPEHHVRMKDFERWLELLLGISACCPFLQIIATL